MWGDPLLLPLPSNQVIGHLFLILGLLNSVYHLYTLFKVFSIGVYIFLSSGVSPQIGVTPLP